MRRHGGLAGVGGAGPRRAQRKRVRRARHEGARPDHERLHRRGAVDDGVAGHPRRRDVREAGAVDEAPGGRPLVGCLAGVAVQGRVDDEPRVRDDGVAGPARRDAHARKVRRPRLERGHGRRLAAVRRRRDERHHVRAGAPVERDGRARFGVGRHAARVVAERAAPRLRQRRRHVVGVVARARHGHRAVGEGHGPVAPVHARHQRRPLDAQPHRAVRREAVRVVDDGRDQVVRTRRERAGARRELARVPRARREGEPGAGDRIHDVPGVRDRSSAHRPAVARRRDAARVHLDAVGHQDRPLARADERERGRRAALDLEAHGGLGRACGVARGCLDERARLSRFVRRPRRFVSAPRARRRGSSPARGARRARTRSGEMRSGPVRTTWSRSTARPPRRRRAPRSTTPPS